MGSDKHVSMNSWVSPLTWVIISRRSSTSSLHMNSFRLCLYSILVDTERIGPILVKKRCNFTPLCCNRDNGWKNNNHENIPQSKFNSFVTNLRCFHDECFEFHYWQDVVYNCNKKTVCHTERLEKFLWKNSVWWFKITQNYLMMTRLWSCNIFLLNILPKHTCLIYIQGKLSRQETRLSTWIKLQAAFYGTHFRQSWNTFQQNTLGVFSKHSSETELVASQVLRLSNAISYNKHILFGF